MGIELNSAYNFGLNFSDGKVGGRQPPLSENCLKHLWLSIFKGRYNSFDKLPIQLRRLIEYSCIMCAFSSVCALPTYSAELNYIRICVDTETHIFFTCPDFGYISFIYFFVIVDSPEKHVH